MRCAGVISVVLQKEKGSFWERKGSFYGIPENIPVPLHAREIPSGAHGDTIHAHSQDGILEVSKRVVVLVVLVKAAWSDI